MKKLLSILLTLAMVLSLLGVMGVAAFADETGGETPEEEIVENEETAPALTILFTGATGTSFAAEEADLTFASAAALKAHHAEAMETLLVDAGGFDITALGIMKAAGYDLVVAEETIETADGETLVVLPSVQEEKVSGVLVNKGGLKIAFIGVDIPAAEEDTSEETDETEDSEEESDPNAALYTTIQEAIGQAREAADYVILLGLCADGETLAENVSGADAILLVDAESTTIEKDEENILLAGVGSAFGSIGVVTITEEGLSAATVVRDDLAALELTDDETVAALESEWTQTPAEDEQPQATPEAEEGASVIPVPTPAVTPAAKEPESTEAPEEPVPTEEPEDAEEPVPTEEPEATAEPAPTEEPEATAEPAPTEEPEVTEGPAPTEEPEVTEGPAPTEEPEATETPVPTEEPEATESPAPTEEPIPTYEWTKGNVDLELNFQNSVKTLVVGGNTLVEGEYYTLKNDGKTAVVSASMMNGWGNARYTFTATFADGTTEVQKVNITGEAPVEDPAGEDQPTQDGAGEATATPAPTATPSPTASPEASVAPNTGDSNPILLYVILLAVLAAALVVVIVMTVRKKK